MQAFFLSLLTKLMERLLTWAWQGIVAWKKRSDKHGQIKDAVEEWQNAKTVQDKKAAFKKLIASTRPPSGV